MRETSVGGFVGGGGNAGTSTVGDEKEAGAASDGATASGHRARGAGATAGPDRVTGASRTPRPEDAPAAPPVPDRDALGPPPGDRTFHAGPKVDDLESRAERDKLKR
jgi:hypothetical protein